MISIIIPIYNAEKYIRKCLLSLLEQTFADIEIIAVDDKGPDQSMQVVKEIQQQHPNGNKIRIVEMERNSGAAAARNKGLEAAQGDYVAFVDSDDWCEPTMYEELYAAAIANNCDWCYSNAVKEYADGRKVVLTQPAVENGELTPKIRRQMLSQFVAYFWTSIYKREFLLKNNITFPLYRFSEDSYFVWMVVMHTKKFASIDKVFYHYIIQSNSVSNIYDGTKHKQKAEVFSLLLNNLRAEGLYNEYKQELDFLFIKKGFFIPLSIYTIYAEKISKEEIRQIFNKIENLIPDYKKNGYLQKNIPLRSLLFLAQTCPKGFAAMMKMYSKNKRESF